VLSQRRPRDAPNAVVYRAVKTQKHITPFSHTRVGYTDMHTSNSSYKAYEQSTSSALH